MTITRLCSICFLSVALLAFGAVDERELLRGVEDLAGAVELNGNLKCSYASRFETPLPKSS